MSGSRIAAGRGRLAGARSAGSVQYSLTYCWQTAAPAANAPVWNQVRVSTGGDQDRWSQLTASPSANSVSSRNSSVSHCSTRPNPRNSRSYAVEVAVVVGVPVDQAVAADPVDRLDTLDHLHGERQPGHPGPAGELVGDIEARRRCVGDPGLGAEVVP